MLPTLLALLAVAAPPAAVVVPLENPGFEAAGPGGAPAGWTLAPGATAAMSLAGEEKGAGARALRLEAPAGGGSATALSTPVKLEVGRLYRLSASLSARGVRADPVARYPTAVGACVSMSSTPFTNCSPTVGGDGSTRVEWLFFAVASTDRVALHLGRNGAATGAATFDDVRLERVDDVTAYVPLESVRWSGKGFRYDDGGWIVVHVEGKPYERGFQYGELVATELARYLEKLAILGDKANPEAGWAHLRQLTDAMMLRGFDAEYLEEMKGIADGAVKGGARFKGRELDLLDVATLNSAVDLGQLDKALEATPHALSGRSFTLAEDEADPARANQDRCSSFVATGKATRDGRFVMGQIFMWNGYAGVHWDVMLDVVPDRGHRVIFQTFPGGIHSGSDWYVNASGIVIGETTVAQTPFEPSGTPQANRARKAAQYASSIDEVARILRERNNGLYTNDWTMADAKTDEGADLLLGTKASRLWRTGSGKAKADTPGNLEGFIWANNNARDPAVRQEYAVTPDDAPVDLTFTPWNRDIAFWRFHEQHGKGGIGLEEAIRLHASSPVNRPHACDGKITTGELARRMVFLAHQGKTTLREKWVGGRWIADLPHAVPHLTQGYTTFSPIVVAEGLARARGATPSAPVTPKPDLAPVRDALVFPRKLLWKGSLRPAGDADGWLSGATATYHGLLRKLPEDPQKALESLREGLAELNLRHEWLARKEPLVPPRASRLRYDRYGEAQLPRLRGTFLLHQLRLELGNEAFSRTMRAVHDRLRGRPASTAEFLRIGGAAAGRDLAPLVGPWLERTDLPAPSLTATATTAGEGKPGWTVSVVVKQADPAWSYATSVELRTAKTARIERLRVKGAETRASFELAERPISVTLDPTGDLPLSRDLPWALPNVFDDFGQLRVVWGTGRQLEANRTLATLWRDTLADAFVEELPPLGPDAEVSDAELAASDLVLVGGPADNAVVRRVLEKRAAPLEGGPGWFRFQGSTYARPEDGLSVALPNPWNPERAVYLTLANSKTQLWRMVRAYQRGLPSFAIWKEGEVTAKGYFGNERLTVRLDGAGAATAAR